MQQVLDHVGPEELVGQRAPSGDERDDDQAQAAAGSRRCRQPGTARVRAARGGGRAARRGSPATVAGASWRARTCPMPAAYAPRDGRR